jgi:hypothetical protein
MTFKHIFALTLCAGAASAMAQSPVAQYDFNNSLASSVAGAPSLGVVDPTGTSGFVTDTVNGVSQTVWNFNGDNANADQGGLTLDTTGLLTSNSVYSLEMVFKFTQRDGAWRRIVDTDSRTLDAGFYVDPSDKVDVYPNGGGSSFVNNVYQDVFLVADNGQVTFYLNGSAQATVASTSVNIDTSNDLYFFLDNLMGGGQGEWSAGDISQIRLYNAALSAVPPPTPPVVASVPEPGTYAMMLMGLGVVAFLARRRAR